MDLDKNLAEHLATWGRTRRGWDKAGCLSQLASVKGRSADDVAMAWVRFCADDNVRSPGAFPNLNGPHWSEKVAPARTPGNPRPHEACRDCGKHHDACLCDGGPTLRVVMPLPDAAPRVERLRAIRAEIAADLCGHGVPRTNCLDHRTPSTTPDPTQGDAS